MCAYAVSYTHLDVYKRQTVYIPSNNDDLMIVVVAVVNRVFGRFIMRLE